MPDRDFITLVCGFGRCGSSLVMQMLEAAGFPVTGEWPAFEDDRVTMNLSAAAWRTQFMGSAVKVLDPQHTAPPAGLNYRGIWLERDHRQQAASQAKFGAAMMGLPDDRRTRRAYARSYAADRPRALAIMSRLCGEYLIMQFEDLIRSPEDAADKIARYLNLQRPCIRIMANTVEDRHPDCLPGFLETTLLERRAS
jgi:hypothetical protein